MKIIVPISHPAHVHQYKNIIWKLKNNGHEIKILLKEKEMARDLLDTYGFSYVIYGENKKGNIWLKLFYQLKLYYRIYNECKIFNPDLLFGRGNPVISHIAKLRSTPYVSTLILKEFL